MVRSCGQKQEEKEKALNSDETSNNALREHNVYNFTSDGKSVEHIRKYEGGYVTNDANANKINVGGALKEKSKLIYDVCGNVTFQIAYLDDGNSDWTNEMDPTLYAKMEYVYDAIRGFYVQIYGYP